MPKVTEERDSLLVGSYRYDVLDWPRSQNISEVNTYPFKCKYADAKKESKLCKIDNQIVNLMNIKSEQDSRDHSFILNICKIVNADIDNFYEVKKVLDERYRNGISCSNEILKYVACNWNLILRLRLMCDVIIKIWSCSSASETISNREKIDCIGRLIYNKKALNIIGLNDNSVYFLMVINRLANEIKHPATYTDLMPLRTEPCFIMYDKEHKISTLQPVSDIIAGSNHFMFTLIISMNRKSLAEEEIPSR